MSRIAILIDVEPGHVLSSFELARRAQAHGHSVAYFAPPDVDTALQRQGFPVFEVLTSALPRGSVDRLRREAAFDPDAFLQLATARVLPALARGEGLGPAIQSFRPDLLIICSLLQLEALAAYLRHDIPIAFFTPNNRRHTREEACRIDLSRLFDMTAGTEEMIGLIRAKLPAVRSLDELVRVLMAVPDLVFLPKALQLPGDSSEPNTYHIGSGVNLGRQEAPFPLIDDVAAPLVYCSLGSQAHFRREVRERFFRVVLQAAACMPQRRFIVAVGPQMDRAAFHPPESVSLVLWAPQLAVLKRAALMINHAGAGAVRECAITGVPMLGFPIGRDQFLVGQRIVHHGLGMVGDIESVTASDLAAMIERAISDPAIRDKLTRVKDEILQEDAHAASIDIFSRILRARRGASGALSANTAGVL